MNSSSRAGISLVPGGRGEASRLVPPPCTPQSVPRSLPSPLPSCHLPDNRQILARTIAWEAGLANSHADPQHGCSRRTTVETAVLDHARFSPLVAISVAGNWDAGILLFPGWSALMIALTSTPLSYVWVWTSSGINDTHSHMTSLHQNDWWG